MRAGGGGRLVDWVTDVANGRKALVLREEQVSQSVGGRRWARTVQTKAQWPGQRLVKIQNESHTLTFQVYDGVRYHCAVREDASLLAALAARRILDGGAPAGGNVSVAYLGFATVEGVYCRGFDVTVRSAGIETRLRVYEDHARRRLFLLQMANLRWRFDALAPIASEAANPLSPADLDMDAILRDCDPPGRSAPPALLEGYLSNAVRPQPAWGAPSNASSRRAEPAGPRDSDAIIMSMADYRAWRDASPRARPGSAGAGGRRAISAGACLSNRGVYTAFTLPPNAAFKSLAELKARGSVKAGLKDPSVAFVWESCNDEVSAYLAGSVGQGCPSITGGIELAVSGLAAGRPVIGVEGSLLASINICSCPPLLLPDAVVPFCPTLSLSIRAALENAVVAEASTCQMGAFPGGNLRMSGDLGLTVGWGVSVAFYASARMYFGFRCASQQPRGSRLKIGHRYQVLRPSLARIRALKRLGRACARAHPHVSLGPHFPRTAHIPVAPNLPFATSLPLPSAPAPASLHSFAPSCLRPPRGPQVSITGNFFWYSKTWSLPIFPTNQQGCATQTNPLTSSPEYVFKPSTSEYAFALFDFGSNCSKA